KPIMQQSHQSTNSFINQDQPVQAFLDTNNPYESVPSNQRQTIHTSSDESNSSIISSDEDDFVIRDEQIRAMAAILPGQVSKEALMYQMLLTSAMKYQYDQENCRNPAKSTFEIPEWYLQPGPNREAISSHGRFYMEKNKITYFTEISTINGTVDWKILTREVLIDVYGSNLKNYCNGSIGPEKTI
ncbi:hypothetical protein PV326_000513, partial [Microctonus aethiopoides]